MLSLCNEVIADLSFADQCKTASALGYKGLEIAPFTLSATPASLTKSERQTLRTIASDHNITISSLHWLLTTPEGLSITSPDTQTLTKTRDHIAAMIELCSDLGGKALVHGSPNQRMLAHAPTHEHARDIALEHFSFAANLSAQANVLYIIEPLSPKLTDFINTIEQALTILELIGSANLATMLDTLAASQAEAQSIPQLLNHHLPLGNLAHIHFNDPNSKAPGLGNLDFAPIIQALKTHNYQGIIAVEPFDYSPSGIACASYAAGYLNGLASQYEYPL